MSIQEDKVGLVKEMIELLNKKLNGTISKSDFESQLETLSAIMKSVGANEPRRVQCKECEDTGMITAKSRSGHMVAVRCSCNFFEREAEKEKSRSKQEGGAQPWWTK